MTGGLHVAGAAMANFARRHDVISNNLANTSTPGFARQDTFLAKLETAEREPFRAPRLDTRTDFTAGTPTLTGNPLDLGLEGSGFFSVQTDRGERFSRLGSLIVGVDGLLRTRDGWPILGENGLIAIGDRVPSIEKDGSVLADGQFLDRLRIVTFASGDDIEREHGGLYVPRAGRIPDPRMERPIVVSGQVEGSSVQPVGELVRMIEAMRSYETAARALRATDTTLQRAVNDVARV
jgi:flagellar basal-body rod protein FlgG